MTLRLLRSDRRVLAAGVAALTVAAFGVSTATAATRVAAPPSSAAASTSHQSWHVQSSVNEQANKRTLGPVSCVGASHTVCVALGDRIDPHGNNSSYSEVGNGKTWHVVYTAHPKGVAGTQGSGLTGYRLHDVSCTSSTRCVAVGSSFHRVGHNRPLAERWNGKSWTVLGAATPHALTSELDHVSCASSTACMAVGTTTAAAKSSPRLLVERWNGSRWTVLHPSLPPHSQVTITSISCATNQVCDIAGAVTKSVAKPFADTFSHGKWSVDTLPTDQGDLAAVACTSSTSCLLIGSSSYSLQGHGGTWTQTAMPGPIAPASVSCVSASSCVAAGGNASEDDGDEGIAESWTGSAWSTIGTADTFLDVSCVRATFCVLVGNEGDEGVPAKYDFWSSDGHTVKTGETPPFPTASRGGFNGEGLLAVSCPSTRMCMAAADQSIDRGNARSWTVSKRVTGEQFLGGVSCPSTRMCMAVGLKFLGGGRTKALAQTWNGQRWSTAAAPKTPALGSPLSAVSCSSQKFCMWMVSETQGQRWNGHRWHPVRLARPRSGHLDPLSVSCASEQFCSAVGTRRPTATPSIEMWRGSHWRLVAAPRARPGAKTFGYSLNSVSCASPTFCLAVGTFIGPGGSASLVERWNGRAWEVIRSRLGFHHQPRAVSCASATTCAVALTNKSSWIYNGSGWTTRPMVRLGHNVFEFVNAVSCVKSVCTAVGVSYYGVMAQRLD